jgi:phosphoserine phosphatase RsbX
VTVNVAYAQRPCPGFSVSGDAAVVRVCDDTALFGVVDALGHGPHAADVARIALSYLEDVDVSRPLEEIVEGLHAALSHTRGAASGLCLARERFVDASVVGNVEVRRVGASLGVVAAPGILGRRVRKFRYSRSELRKGDRVVVFSDGLSRVELEPVRTMAPPEACRNLLHRHGRAHDDATVLIADFDS